MKLSKHKVACLIYYVGFFVIAVIYTESWRPVVKDAVGGPLALNINLIGEYLKVPFQLKNLWYSRKGGTIYDVHWVDLNLILESWQYKRTSLSLNKCWVFIFSLMVFISLFLHIGSIFWSHLLCCHLANRSCNLLHSTQIDFFLFFFTSETWRS